MAATRQRLIAALATLTATPTFGAATPAPMAVIGETTATVTAPPATMTVTPVTTPATAAATTGSNWYNVNYGSTMMATPEICTATVVTSPPPAGSVTIPVVPVTMTVARATCIAKHLQRRQQSFRAFTPTTPDSKATITDKLQ